MILITKTTVDLISPNLFSVIYAKQKDAGRGIEVTLTANGIIFVLEDTDIVNIFVTKPDGHVCYNSCEISDGKAIVPLTTQTLAVDGKAKCEIEVIRGNSRLTNPAFILQIFPTNTDEEAVLSEDEIGVVASLASALAVERARINMLAKMTEESTSEDEVRRELGDVRVGFDGKEYPTAGEAVRGQVSQLSEQIEGITQNNINGLSDSAKKMIITILRNAVYTNDQSAIITALETALAENESGGDNDNGDAGETEVTLTGISTTYSGGDVAVGTEVSALTDIVVTAVYSDGSTETVTGYTLSGEIAEGVNTITVSYCGMTTTFTVTGIHQNNFVWIRGTTESNGRYRQSGLTRLTPYKKYGTFVAVTVTDTTTTGNGGSIVNDNFRGDLYLATIPSGATSLTVPANDTFTIAPAIFDVEGNRLCDPGYGKSIDLTQYPTAVYYGGNVKKVGDGIISDEMWATCDSITDFIFS